MSEFCLSDKGNASLNGEDWINKEDVKEFIRLLKFEMDLTLENAEIINKLAGELV